MSKFIINVKTVYCSNCRKRYSKPDNPEDPMNLLKLQPSRCPYCGAAERSLLGKAVGKVLGVLLSRK